MIEWIVGSAIASVAGSLFTSHKQIKSQEKIAREARKITPPAMERSEEEASVRLGTIDNELTPSTGGQGSAVAATKRTNQIGQLGGT